MELKLKNKQIAFHTKSLKNINEQQIILFNKNLKTF